MEVCTKVKRKLLKEKTQIMRQMQIWRHICTGNAHVGSTRKMNRTDKQADV